MDGRFGVGGGSQGGLGGELGGWYEGTDGSSGSGLFYADS